MQLININVRYLIRLTANLKEFNKKLETSQKFHKFSSHSTRKQHFVLVIVMIIWIVISISQISNNHGWTRFWLQICSLEEVELPQTEDEEEDDEESRDGCTDDHP